MGTRSLRQRVLPAVVAGVLVATMAACTPSPTTSAVSEACAPAGTLIGSASISILEAPPGSSLRADILVILNPGTPGEDSGIDTEVMDGLAAGQTRTISVSYPLLDPGRCMHLFPDPGVRYQVTLVANPVLQLLRALGVELGPNVVRGFEKVTPPLPI